MPITIVTPNSVLPLSLADTKLHIKSLSTDEDGLITDYIWSAVDYVESLTGLAILDTTIDETFAAWDGDALQLSRAPVSSITSVKYYDGDSAEQTWVSSSYLTHSPTDTRGWLEIAPDTTLPGLDTRAYPWTVRYVAGYGSAESSTPDRIKHALRLLVEDFDRFRGSFITGADAGKIAAPTAVAVERLISLAMPGMI